MSKHTPETKTTRPVHELRLGLIKGAIWANPIRGANLPDDCSFKDDDFVFVLEEKADALKANNAHPGDVIFTQRGTHRDACR